MIRMSRSERALPGPWPDSCGACPASWAQTRGAGSTDLPVTAEQPGRLGALTVTVTVAQCTHSGPARRARAGISLEDHTVPSGKRWQLAAKPAVGTSQPRPARRLVPGPRY